VSRFVIYLDEDNQDLRLVAALQRAGIDVHRSGAESMDGATDEEQLQLAAKQRWVVYTSNARDFNRIHRRYIERGLEHSGVIIRYERQFSIGEQVRRITRIWEALSAEQMVNRVESITQWGQDRS
jgi:hypothetical protein